MVYVEVGIVLLIFAEFCGQLAMISSDILEKFGKFAARLSGKNPAIMVSSTSGFVWTRIQILYSSLIVVSAVCAHVIENDAARTLL